VVPRARDSGLRARNSDPLARYDRGRHGFAAADDGKLDRLADHIANQLFHELIDRPNLRTGNAQDDITDSAGLLFGWSALFQATTTSAF